MPKTIIKPPRPVINRAHPLAKGLVGCWSFFERGGTTLRDISGKNNNGTLTAMDPATDWVRTPRGYALDFDGVDDYVNTTLDPSTELGQEITMEAWVRPSAQNDNDGILGGHGITGTKGIFLQYGSGAWQSGFTNGTSWFQFSFGNLTLDSWSHIVAVIKGGSGGYVKNYVNLTEFSYANSANIVHEIYFYIGCAWAYPGRYFQGVIDEVRIYNRALTFKEIVQDYADPFALYRFPKQRLGKAPITEDYGDFFSVMMP